MQCTSVNLWQRIANSWILPWLTSDIYFSVYQAQSLPYNYKVDIYSLGVILFELLVPFGTDMERSCALMNVRNNKFPEDFQ